MHGTKKQAEKELAKFYADCEAGRISKSSTATVEQVADLYVSEYADRHLKVSARRSVDTALKVWIKPLIGKKKISRLSRIDIQQWINHMSDGENGKQGLSPKTIRNYYSVLCGIMEFAIDMEFIQDTPCKNIRLPKKEHHEAEYYNLEEVKSLLKALDSLPVEELKFKVAILHRIVRRAPKRRNFRFELGRR